VVYYLPDTCGEGRMVGHDLQLVPELAEIHANVRSRHGQIRAWYTITVRILDNGNWSTPHHRSGVLFTFYYDSYKTARIFLLVLDISVEDPRCLSGS
jgi:hypothetical protein